MGQLEKEIATRTNPGKLVAYPKVMNLCAPFLSLPLSPIQIVSPTSNSVAGGKLQLSRVTTDQLVVFELAQNGKTKLPLQTRGV